MKSLDLPARIRQRLFEQTDQSGDHWFYPGSGKLNVDGRWVRVNQAWFALSNGGRLPRRIDNSCGVAGCVNPEHWFDSDDGTRRVDVVESELRHHSGGGYYYVANRLTGGKQIGLGKDRAKAIELWRDGREQLRAGVDWHPKHQRRNSGRATMGQMCSAFLVDLKRKQQAGKVTREHYNGMRGVCDRMVEHFGRRTIVETLQPAGFTGVADAVQVCSKTGRLRNWGGYAGEIRKMRHVFSWAKRNRIIPHLPEFGDSFPLGQQAYERIANRNQKEGIGQQPKAAAPRTFSRDEIRRMLDVAPTDVRAWILVGLNLAMENKELSVLAGSDLGQTRAGEWWFQGKRIKSAEPRSAMLWPETVEAITEYKATRPQPADPALAKRVFLNCDGYPIRAAASNSQFCKKFRAVMKAADCYVPGRGFRALRHTFRTVSGIAGDLEASEFVMGHKQFARSLSAESATYTHDIAPARLRAVVMAVHAWLFSDELTTPAETDVVATMEF